MHIKLDIFGESSSIDLISSNNDFINYNIKLFIAVLLKCINQNTKKKENNPRDLKLFNVLFKLIDKYPFEQSEDQNITSDDLTLKTRRIAGMNF